MMSRESIVNHDGMPRTGTKKTVTTPNYSTGITSPHNSNVLDLGTNKNVITEAVTKLAFNELRFECVGSVCGEFPDTESIYFDSNKSAFSQKSGGLSRKSGGFPWYLKIGKFIVINRHVKV